MNKDQYIQQFGYISNNDFKRAVSKSKDFNIRIEDWKLPDYLLLNDLHIKLMIELRLHLKFNCIAAFKNNFYRMDALPHKKGIKTVNYTGHSLCYDGSKFFGDYKFCIHKHLNPISVEGEELYIINGLYPVYSITSCLEEDLRKVLNTNSSWCDTSIIKIIPYK